MTITRASPADTILGALGTLLPDLQAVYTDIHAHPELSAQETRTAGIAAQRLRAAGFEVTTGVGNTGVVGLLRTGEGPTVMLRADMDALPVAEATGLPYASTVTGADAEGKTVPVMHACGHDMHVTWLIGAATLFAQARASWHGTLMAVFQPAEETGTGARAMVDDGLLTRFPKPDVILAQHLMKASAGMIGWRAGVVTSAGDSFQVRLFGRGAHGSMPEASVDPVVMAAATVMRLQTIVSREVAATESAVVTVGELQAGTKENVIPDEALLKLNVRTFDENVRTRVLAAIERIINAEAAASGAPKTTGDRAARPLPAGEERRGSHDAGRGRLPPPLPGRAAAGDQAGIGERGLRRLRQRVAGAVGLLVRWRHRSRPVRERQGGGPALRAADQPQPALRPGPPPDPRDRGGNPGGRCRGVAHLRPGYAAPL